MPTIDQLVYRSRAFLADTDRASIDAIVESAARNNARDRITGALVLHHGWFVQILEGSPAALDNLIVHLHFDTRHSEIEVLDRVRVARRDFADWAMVAPSPSARAGARLTALLKSGAVEIGPYRTLFLELLADEAEREPR